MSALSFHCMICFEQFGVEVRYPVVLPCGHTYVCKQCADRLDRCMECRTPLSMLITPNSQDANSSSKPLNPANSTPYGTRSPITNRYGENVAPKSPPKPPLKRRLPLPKNVVLLSLIEATQLAAKEAAEIDQNRLLASGTASGSVTMIDDDVEEEAKIRQGTTLAISESGTYAVSAKEGLDIFSSNPNIRVDPAQTNDGDTGDIDDLVRFLRVDHNVGAEHSKESKEGDKTPEPTRGRLNCGDRVQVVATENGWAKLARGYGYVRTDGNRLVKVGSPVDRACKLEALLRLLSSQRKRLQDEQLKIEDQFVALIKELQASLLKDEDRTIIIVDSTDHDENVLELHDDEQLHNHNVSEVLIDRAASMDKDHTPLKPRPMERSLTPPLGYFCSSDVFDAVMKSTSSFSSAPPPSLPSSTALNCVPASQISPYLHQSQSTTSNRSIFRTASHPSTAEFRDSVEVWREMRDRPTNTGIDFRTGMSGHLGLLSTHNHPHDFLKSRPRARPRNQFLSMSNHTGLTMWRPKPSRPNSGSGGVTPPSASFEAASTPPRNEATNFRSLSSKSELSIPS